MRDFLRRIPLFADLPPEDLERLCAAVEVVELEAGAMLFAEGEPGDRAYVIRDGEVDIVKHSAGRDVLLARRGAGDVIGEMALLETSRRTATVHAHSAAVLWAIRKAELDALLASSPSAAITMFETVMARWRATESLLRQSEKMAQLGTLTAGVAHELNNPAAAVRRGAEQLDEVLTRLFSAQTALNAMPLSRTELATLEAHVANELPTDAPLLDALARSDREAVLEDWLEDHDVDEAWRLAPALVTLGFDEEAMSELAARFASDRLPAVIAWLEASHSARTVLREIREGTARISDIVGALKSYAYLDQAPMQAVDIHRGLDDTLLILRHKLGGVTVLREYDDTVPLVDAYGGELNQVWTNLLDNAADAVDGGGTITIRTRREADEVLVEVEDDGPGIPDDVRDRVFDPFFTTKPVGSGTGLGLDISQNIVVRKHGGELAFTSEPGRTVFTVRLPFDPVQ